MDRYFQSFENIPFEEFERGIRIKSLSLEKAQIRYMEFDPGSVTPDHRHPEEVTTMILEGTMEMTVGKETKVVSEGGIFVVPPHTGHSGRISTKRVLAVSWSPRP
ncbi:MAG: conserved hypothetical protein [Leptospirillum rubarum]|uniref:Cupin type-2 domain-containing protein n=1 Tax=Leptospirillum sp. Group II '5-way CG' TaxID=419541 RepID=B6AS82_9BACT|nr:MAG: conserved hypothetical protein [Leptospirillum rubarum]EDZ38300.1 MAG: Conserved hypothetical protein [Leptospirillum sp. Group II '5-way CG']